MDMQIPEDELRKIRLGIVTSKNLESLEDIMKPTANDLEDEIENREKSLSQEIKREIGKNTTFGKTLGL